MEELSSQLHEISEFWIPVNINEILKSTAFWSKLVLTDLTNEPDTISPKASRLFSI